MHVLLRVGRDDHESVKLFLGAVSYLGECKGLFREEVTQYSDGMARKLSKFEYQLQKSLCG